LNLSKNASSRLEAVRRENRELGQMRDHEAEKCRVDLEHLKMKYETVMGALRVMREEKKAMEAKINELEGIAEEWRRDRAEKDRQRKRAIEEAKDKREKESKCIRAIARESRVFLTVMQFIEVKEYIRMASMSREFQEILIGGMGTKACLEYIKLK
jgi:hypothetical protein